MKKTLIALILFLSAFQLSAQILHPVKWSYGAKKISDTEAILFVRATIEDDWHIYSVHQKPGGPLKTSLKFTPARDYVLVEQLIEPKPKVGHDDNFDVDVASLDKTVIFQQRIKIRTKQLTVKGSVEFMVCNDHQCLPPETIKFSIPVK